MHHPGVKANTYNVDIKHASTRLHDVFEYVTNVFLLFCFKLVLSCPHCHSCLGVNVVGYNIYISRISIS